MAIRYFTRFLSVFFVSAALVYLPFVHAQTDEPLNENFIVPTPDELRQEAEEESNQPSGTTDDRINEEDGRRNEGPPPEIQRDLARLPQPVRRRRELILEAAMSGEIEKLRDLVGIGETATTLSIGGLEGDPIDFLKEASGDQDGYEILAI